jgi:hypothetical protein
MIQCSSSIAQMHQGGEKGLMLFWLVRKTRGAALPQTVVLSRRHISLPDLSGAFKQ